MNHSKIATRGEDIAADFLEEEGWEIVARNVFYKVGEIDIIAKKTVSRGYGKAILLAFVEVKTRTSTKDPKSAERAITSKKRKKIILASKIYLQKNPISCCVARFDVIAITLKEKPDIRYYPNAFDGHGRIR